MTTPETTEDALAARYGRTPAAARRTKFIAIVSAIAFTIVFVLWLWWGGLLGAPAQFEARDTGFDVVDDSTVSVSWQFSVEPGTSASCVIQAMNSTFAIVGWKVVELPPSDTRTRAFTEPLLTTEEAVTGLIYRCWLT